jgi:hypothetical protein
MTRAHVTALFAAMLLAASGCSLATADIDIPRTCITQSTLVPGSPIGADVTSPPVALDIGQDLPLLQDSAGDTLVIEDVHITPTSGQPDLSGIASAEVAVGAQPTAVASYTASGGTPAELVLSGTGVNLTPFLANGQIQLTVTFHGTPPPTAWNAEVVTCAHGASHVSY